MADKEIIYVTGLEIEIFMKGSQTENQFQTSFQQPKSSLQKTQYQYP